jgi:hypothetical protein
MIVEKRQAPIFALRCTTWRKAAGHVAIRGLAIDKSIYPINLTRQRVTDELGMNGSYRLGRSLWKD